jgi:hypothetical protein
VNAPFTSLSRSVNFSSRSSPPPLTFLYRRPTPVHAVSTSVHALDDQTVPSRFPRGSLTPSRATEAGKKEESRLTRCPRFLTAFRSALTALAMAPHAEARRRLQPPFWESSRGCCLQQDFTEFRSVWPVKRKSLMHCRSPECRRMLRDSRRASQEVRRIGGI